MAFHQRLLISIASLYTVLTCQIAGAQQSVPISQAPKRADVIGSGSRPVSGAELPGLLIGNTTYDLWLTAPQGSDYRSGDVVQRYFRDRSIARSRNKGVTTDTRWWIEGNALCSEITRNGRACFVLYPFKGQLVACDVDWDDCPLLVRIVPGNPESY